jgi:serine/threonine protein kinase
MAESYSKEAIFFTALDKPTPEARAAFLDEACAGDENLRRQVDHLLASHPRVGRFLERPVRESTDLPGWDAAPDEAGIPLDFLAPSHRPDGLGRLGHYEVLEVLGSGGMGIVLRAFDEKLSRVVAIKALAPALAVVGAARRRFVREARGAASVIHDNVVAIHAVEDAGPVPYLVMPFIDGPTLQQKIDRDGPLPVVEVLRIGVQIAAGLAAAHAQGLVHRDVKPANILLENGVERVKITDFGLARTADDPGVTQPGLIAGTPAYMSPEQANGEHVDHRSDLFSVGSVMYALCTGYPPFRAATAMAVMKQVCDHVPRPVREVNPDIPDWLEALIASLHARNPASRPQTAAEVAEMLGRRLADLQQPNRTSTPQETSRRPPELTRRSASRWLPTIAALVLLAAGLGMTETTGVTDVRGTVVRLFHPDGTLVVEVDDPAVSVAIDGTDLVITGEGVREVRLKPGAYQVRASKDGRVVRQELVTVSRDGRQVVRISQEAAPLIGGERWEPLVAAMPADKQLQAVVRRLQELNPGFNGELTHTVENGKVTELRLHTDHVTDLSPLRVLRSLRVLRLPGSPVSKGKLSDLGPLRGLSLNRLEFDHTQVADLEPLRGMPLVLLNCGWTRVADLSPLKGMKLHTLTAQATRVSDLTPLQGMPMGWLDLYQAREVTDLGQLKGLPAQFLNLSGLTVSDISPIADLKSLRWLFLEDTPVSDLTPLKGLGIHDLYMKRTRITDLTPIKGLPLKRVGLDYRPDRAEFLRSFATLEVINDKPAAEFWKDVEKK